MTATAIVRPLPDLGPTTLDLSELWAHAFPSVDLVRASAAMLTPLRGWDGAEGPRARIIIGPGAVQVARRDLARRERSEHRQREGVSKMANLQAGELLLEHRLEQSDLAASAVSQIAAAGLVGWAEVERQAAESDYLAGRIEIRDREAAPAAATITAWSSKSRTNMVRTLGQIDYAPLFAGEGIPAMVTLTYPGDWLPVAANAGVCKRQIDTFKRRFLRAYGRPLVGIWKREFQHRGAPHYHILMVPPREHVNGEHFTQWAGRVWSEVVGHPDPDERAKHRARGVDVSYAEGMRARDPKRLAVYFSKHGAFAAKEYQNHAPAEWLHSDVCRAEGAEWGEGWECDGCGGSVGRFWGVWGLSKGTAVVEVTEVEARAAARTMRRWQAANGYRVQREVWRTNTKTGVMRKRKSGVWSGARMQGLAGFVMVNDGAAFVATLARHLDAVREAAQAEELEAWASSPVRLRSLDR